MTIYEGRKNSLRAAINPINIKNNYDSRYHIRFF